MPLPKMPEAQFQKLLQTSRAIRAYQSYQHGRRPSKRSVKNNGRGVGQVLKNSRIQPVVNLEWHFPNNQRL